MFEMLLSENFLKTVVEQMKVADIFGSLLFQWNCKQKCFQLKSERKQHVYKYRLVTSLLFAVLVYLQILCTWNNANIFAKIHSLFHVCVLILFCNSHTIFHSNAQLIVSYLNAMLVLENRRKGNFFN